MGIINHLGASAITFNQPINLERFIKKRKTDLRPEKKTRTHCGAEKMLLAKLPLITAIDRYFLWLLIRMRVWTLGSAICNGFSGSSQVTANCCRR